MDRLRRMFLLSRPIVLLQYPGWADVVRGWSEVKWRNEPSRVADAAAPHDQLHCVYHCPLACYVGEEESSGPSSRMRHATSSWVTVRVACHQRTLWPLGATDACDADTAHSLIAILRTLQLLDLQIGAKLGCACRVWWCVAGAPLVHGSTGGDGTSERHNAYGFWRDGIWRPRAALVCGKSQFAAEDEREPQARCAAVRIVKEGSCTPVRRCIPLPGRHVSEQKGRARNERRAIPQVSATNGACQVDPKAPRCRVRGLAFETCENGRVSGGSWPQSCTVRDGAAE